MPQHPYCRALNQPDLIEHFLQFTLATNDYKDASLIRKINACEIEIEKYKSTLAHPEFRDRAYRDEDVRWELRQKIVDELFTLVLPDKDENISLGVGGALPVSNVQEKKQAYIVIGLPASGKSGISREISENFGSVIIDSDFSKRKLPEFENTSSGATLVNEESGCIVYGFDKHSNIDFVPLLKRCTKKGLNMVIPQIGYDREWVRNFAEILKLKEGYDVHLTLVNLDRKRATVRALERYKKTERYVPLSLIFDAFSNDPILNYYRLKKFHHDLFCSFGKISTDGDKIEVVESDTQNPALIFK